MSLTARVLLIVFGSLAALLIGSVSLLVYSGYHMASSASDPATIRRVAAEFGNFDVPPGYHVTMAMDMMISKSLILNPIHPQKGHYFAIILGRSAMPGIVVPQEAMKRSLSSTTSTSLRIPGCKHLAPATQESIESKVGTIVLRSTSCDDAGRDMKTASAFFSVKDGIIYASASGSKAGFDLAAMRSLLASFR